MQSPTRSHTPHLAGDDIQIWRLGVCLLMTYVPRSPSFTVSTPCCAVGSGRRAARPCQALPACLGGAARTARQQQQSISPAGKRGRESAQDSRCTRHLPQSQCPPQTPARRQEPFVAAILFSFCSTFTPCSGSRRPPARLPACLACRRRCPRDLPPAAPAGRPGWRRRPSGIRPPRARGTPWEQQGQGRRGSGRACSAGRPGVVQLLLQPPVQLGAAAPLTGAPRRPWPPGAARGLRVWPAPQGGRAATSGGVARQLVPLPSWCRLQSLRG